MKKIKYLFWSFINSFSKDDCGHCGSHEYDVVERKYLVTSLIECKNCHLRYRILKDKLSYLQNFYQSEYKVANKLMITFPSETELVHHKQTNFKDIRNY